MFHVKKIRTAYGLLSLLFLKREFNGQVRSQARRYADFA